MSDIWKQLALDNTSAVDARKIESVQSLWSGFGEIFRVQLEPASLGTLIIKQIIPPNHSQHPRGWNTDRSLARKLKSYDVESYWYQTWSQQCDECCRVPRCISSIKDGDKSWILMEDLDASGFNRRFTNLSVEQAKPCLAWLANFHARFLNVTPRGLWSTGTYWHLDTRPDEFAAMQEGPLKNLASDIDQLLSRCQYLTLVHGDAKVANFCFNNSANNVAAVDFQYVGGGCGMKDVAYFFGSCFNEQECERYIPALLDYYFSELSAATDKSIDCDALEREWRSMFAPAWTDFYRFLLGWLPEGDNSNPKIHSYTRKLAEQTIAHPLLN